MPLFWISIAFLSGIVLGSISSQSVSVWFLAAGLSLGLLLKPGLAKYLSAHRPALHKFLHVHLSFSWAKQLSKRVSSSPLFASTLISPPTLIALILFTFFLGAARYRISLPNVSPDFIAYYNDNNDQMIVTGILISPPDVRDNYINLRIGVERLRFDKEIYHTDVGGILLARVPIDGEWHYGERLILRGILESPFENEEFSYRNYLSTRGIYTLMPYAEVSLLESNQGNAVKQIMFSIKDKALELVYRLFPDPEASLFAGILLGVESGISANVQDAFKDTGTSHIIVISGFNIAILAGLFTKYLSQWLGSRKGAILAAIIIAAYTILVGGDASVVRAAIMGWLGLFAHQVGRRQNGVNSLAFAAAGMALFSPQVLWDVGFQLSFAATLGLILFAEPLSDTFLNYASPYISEERLARITKSVGEYFLFTIAASITTLPVILYHFQRLSLSFLPANLAILPVQPPIMVLGGIAVLLSFILYPLGQLVAYFAWPFAAYTIRVVEWFASFSSGVLLVGEVSLFVVLLLYIVLFGFTIAGDRIRSLLPPIRPSLVVIFLGLLTVLGWQSVLNRPDGLLHVTFMDVGTGDAILIKSPTGRYVLVGGGPSSTMLSDALGRRLPMFQRKLDFLVIAAPREEQVRALPFVIRRFPPDQVLWAGASNASRSARFLQSEITDAGIPINLAQAGDVLELGGGARLEVLAASRRGAVLLLTWQHFRLLLPLGMDFEYLEESQYGGDLGSITALLLADSGYSPLNPQEWIDNLSPQLILIGVAAGNYDGLPSLDTLQHLQAYTVRRTDRSGWIMLHTDGEEFWVEVEKLWIDEIK